MNPNKRLSRMTMQHLQYRSYKNTRQRYGRLFVLQKGRRRPISILYSIFIACGWIRRHKIPLYVSKVQQTHPTVALGPYSMYSPMIMYPISIHLFIRKKNGPTDHSLIMRDYFIVVFGMKQRMCLPVPEAYSHAWCKFIFLARTEVAWKCRAILIQGSCSPLI